MNFDLVVARFTGALDTVSSAPAQGDRFPAAMEATGGFTTMAPQMRLPSLRGPRRRGVTGALVLSLVVIAAMAACRDANPGGASSVTRTTSPSPTIHADGRSSVVPVIGATATPLTDAQAQPERVAPAPTSVLPLLPTSAVDGGSPTTGNGPLQVPIRVRIPRIRVDAPVEIVGLEADGTMSTPRAFEDVGWYGYSPVPGDVGTAVIAGHVDSVRGPAVFWSLHDLRPGDQIEVDLTGGTTRRFIVEGAGLYLSNEAPLAEIFSWTGRPRLDLITCEGVFDPVRHAYDKRLVVYSRLDPASSPTDHASVSSAELSSQTAHVPPLEAARGSFTLHVPGRWNEE